MERTRNAMRRRATKALACSAALAAAALATPAPAATVAFTGTRENANPVGPPGTGRCAPTYFSTSEITPGNFSSTGMSNFGAFTATMSHCNVAPGIPRQIVDGLLTYDFAAGDSLFGTYTGELTFGDMAGVFNSLHNITVTGGTGRFLNASGFLVNLGTVRVGQVNGVPAGIFEGTVEGRLDLSAVPEPATWAMLIGGFGLIGAALRRRRRRIAASAC